MKQGYELFHQEGDFKKQSLMQSIDLCRQEIPLDSSIGVYDTRLHRQNATRLTNRGSEVRKYLSKLRAHQRKLEIAEELKQQEVESAQMLVAMDRAYEWASRYREDSDAVESLQQLGPDEEARRQRMITNLEAKLYQVQRDLSTLL